MRRPARSSPRSRLRFPEAPNSGRNWDYRYCWIRDAFFVVRALNSLAAVRTMENYFGWMMNVIANAGLVTRERPHPARAGDWA
jgi:GH15 family glucan-1,4-alpha-glucosidase